MRFFIVGIITSILLAYWFLGKKIAGFKKIFIPLLSLLCGRLYKTSHKNTQKDDKNRDK